MAGFWNWLLNGEPMRREEAPPSDPSTATIIPARSAAARSVGANDALSLSMVFRAVQVLATSAGSLSLDAYRGDTKLDPAPGFIRQPDMDETRPAFLEMTTVSLATQGNAYWRVYRDQQNRVTNLVVLNPLDVTIEHTQSGRVTGYQHAGRVLPPEEIRHLKFLRVPGTPYGLGPIQAAQTDLRGALDVRDYASNWFEGSGMPSGVLTTDQHVTPEQAKESADSWHDTPAGRVRVLGNGLEFKAVYLSPRDAQFLESQNFNVTQMTRLFGMPSSLMLANVEGNSQTYQNVAQDWLAFYRFTLAKYTREIELAFTQLLPRGSEARFNFEAFLRTDTESRYKAHREAIAMGLYSAEYARQIENIPESAAPKAAPTEEAPVDVRA